MSPTAKLQSQSQRLWCDESHLCDRESDFSLSATGRTAQTKVWNEIRDIIHKQDPKVQA
jgi:hypothetical protein